jgi:hypothetical protein
MPDDLANNGTQGSLGERIHAGANS